MKLVLLLLAICVAPSCFAQYGEGIILGNVKDASGAVVPGATVTARNAQTGENRTFTTDTSGDFRFNAVPPGTYTLSAASPAFKTSVISNLVVTV
ncbi:MAG TPA: carboxypeptidase-like regulatory domain-containing protein, partial [Bryobacteraceae bacterium]|nr:carboxypeptidase-like regulatory domain-containing protein [Bryobacteraceae bacterium]